MKVACVNVDIQSPNPWKHNIKSQVDWLVLRDTCTDTCFLFFLIMNVILKAFY